MTDSKLSPEVLAQRRIAASRQAAPVVDANGRPVGKTTTYEYDDDGKLVAATPDDAA